MEPIAIIDHGQESGILIERYERWLNFECDRVSLGVNLEIGHECADGPIAMYLNNCELDGPWTMDDLRALHRDLGRLLADARLPGAMDEAWAYYDAHPKP